MAIGVTYVSGPMGPSGPNNAGEYQEEIISFTGDGAATTVTASPKWLKRIAAVIGADGITIVAVIANAPTNPPTIALTFSAAPANGVLVSLLVRGWIA